MFSVCKVWFPQEGGPNVSGVVPLAVVELPRRSSSVACVKGHTAKPSKTSVRVIMKI